MVYACPRCVRDRHLVMEQAPEDGKRVCFFCKRRAELVCLCSRRQPPAAWQLDLGVVLLVLLAALVYWVVG